MIGTLRSRAACSIRYRRYSQNGGIQYAFVQCSSTGEWPTDNRRQNKNVILAAALLRFALSGLQCFLLFSSLRWFLSSISSERSAIFLSLNLFKTWRSQLLQKNGSLGRRVLRSTPNACAYCFRYRPSFFPLVEKQLISYALVVPKHRRDQSLYSLCSRLF